MTNKRILVVANTASMVKLFNMRNIEILRSLGCEVFVAANFSNPGTISLTEAHKFEQVLKEMNIKFFNIPFKRKIGNPIANYQAKKTLCSIIDKYSIDMIHTHAPLSSIIARSAAHTMGIKCIYTSHGFQFFPGGSIKDWIFFYPIERFYSRWTDALITINKDDYQVAKTFPVSRLYYIPGIGADIKSSLNLSKETKLLKKKEIRNRLKIAPDDFVILSVGELTKRKNHETVIKAIATLNNKKIQYFIAGIGPEKDNLLALISSLKLEKQVHLLGFRNDVRELYLGADLNVFVSRREGLGMGGLDGVALGVYTIGSARTGIKDYIFDRKTGELVENPTDVQEIATIIKSCVINRPHSAPNDEELLKFDKSYVDQLMTKIYKEELLR